MGASLAVETAAINNRVIIKSRAKGAREIGRSVKGALFPTNRNESGNVQGPRTMRWTTENEGEREREKWRPRVPANPSPVIKRFGEQPVRKIVNESPWTVRPVTQLRRAIYLGQLDRTESQSCARYYSSKICIVQERSKVKNSWRTLRVLLSRICVERV